MKPDIRSTVFCFAIGLVITGCSTKPAQKEREAPKVTVDRPLLRKEVNYDEFTGSLDAVKTIIVQSQVAGELKVDHIKDKEGKLVKEGETLFELDPDPFTVQVSRAEAVVKKYEAEKEGAVKEIARLEELLKSGGATQRQLDKVRADAGAFDASIKAAQQDVKYYNLQFSYSKIKSPIAGTVNRANIQPGNLVAPGANGTILTTIVSPDVYVFFNVDERTFQNYQKGHTKDKEPAVITFLFKLDTDNDYIHTGFIDFKENKVEKSTGTLLVRGRVKEAKGPLLSGSAVRVRVPITDEYEAMLVPDTAILTDQDRKYVLVVTGDDNVVNRRDVRTGKLCDDGMRVIFPAAAETGKVTKDDRVIIEGLQRARLLYPVQPIPVKKAEK